MSTLVELFPSGEATSLAVYAARNATIARPNPPRAFPSGPLNLPWPGQVAQRLQPAAGGADHRSSMLACAPRASTWTRTSRSSGSSTSRHVTRAGSPTARRLATVLPAGTTNPYVLQVCSRRTAAWTASHSARAPSVSCQEEPNAKASIGAVRRSVAAEAAASVPGPGAVPEQVRIDIESHRKRARWRAHRAVGVDRHVPHVVQADHRERGDGITRIRSPTARSRCARARAADNWSQRRRATSRPPPGKTNTASPSTSS